MAVQKTGTGRTTKKKPAGKEVRISLSAIFWIALLIIIICAFFTLLPKIENFKFFSKIAEIEKQNEQSPTTPLFKLPKPQEQKPSASTQKPQSAPAQKPQQAPAQKPHPAQKPPEKKPETLIERVKESLPHEKKPSAEKPKSQTPKPKTQPEKKPAATVSAQPTQPSPPDAKPFETRNRNIYLIQEGTMSHLKITRSLKNSDTPLKDSINALLAGPTADEKKHNIISLIPAGSKLLSVKVDGNTAYLNFNQEFRYNTRGREGCAAQIRQIVWTATEFSNIQNVQILIEGKVVDFLSEGVTIRNPISR